MGTGKRNILIIDRDRSVGVPLQRTLEKAGYTVTLSIDGSELFQKKQKIPLPHMVLLDIMELHPGMDTFRFIRVFKSSAKTSKSKIIVCSSSQTDADVSMAKSAGADAFIGKPVDPEEVVSHIDKVLYGSAAPERISDTGQPDKVKKEKTWVDFRRKVDTVPADGRRHPRLEFHCPVRIDGLKGVHNITDISLGGIFVELENTETFEIGQVRQLVIKFPTEYDPIKVTAEVANVRKRGVGLRYVNLTQKNQETIRFCFNTFRDTIPLR